MSVVTAMRELLEAGVHFGHQTRRWNPKMWRFIFGERAGSHTHFPRRWSFCNNAHQYLSSIGERTITVLFVGTEKQCQDAVEEQARRVSMLCTLNHRWLEKCSRTTARSRSASGCCTSSAGRRLVLPSSGSPPPKEAP